jgi:hypothetical protein
VEQIINLNFIQMDALINRNQEFGMLNDVIKKNHEILTIINNALKINKAKLIIDTPTTLFYHINI